MTGLCDHHRLLAVFEPDHQGFEAVVKAWIDRLVADRDLFDEATLWLSRRLGWPGPRAWPIPPRQEFCRVGDVPGERLTVIVGDGSSKPACRWLLCRAMETQGTDGGRAACGP